MSCLPVPARGVTLRARAPIEVVNSKSSEKKFRNFSTCYVRTVGSTHSILLLQYYTNCLLKNKKSSGKIRN